MALTREGRSSVGLAYLSQIHPVFMLPPLAASLFGGVLAGSITTSIAVVHLLAMGAAVYTAHIKDGYVDFHVRGEDDDNPLTVLGCVVGLVLATGTFVLASLALWILVDAWAVLLTVPAWVIAFHHAPQLDMNPFTATMGYPVGIALALLGGFYVQVRTLSLEPIAFAFVFIVLLSGIKIIDDATDYDYDRTISKRTVAVLVGRSRARSIAYGLMGVALGITFVASVLHVFPPATLLAIAVFGVVGSLAYRHDPKRATMLLIRGTYLFLAVLMAIVWIEPTVTGSIL